MLSELYRRTNDYLHASPIVWARARQAIQAGCAAIISFAIAHYFALPQGYWSVMAAILVVQASVGASFGMAVDRLLATLLGAFVGAAVVGVLGTGYMVTMIGLFASVLLLTYLASKRPSLRFAPVTAAIVLLGDIGHNEPVAAAANRIAEIGLGSVVGVAVSLFLFPSRAGASLSEHVAKLLPLLAKHLSETIDAALGRKFEEGELLAFNDQIRAQFAAGDALAIEARRELAGRLADHADPSALLRTLRRVWNTELMAARSTRVPLPESAVEVLKPALLGVRQSVSDFLAALADVCMDAAQPPATGSIEIALDRLDRTMAQLRASGIARAMSADDVARLFSLSYAIGELRQNLTDLRDRCRDLRTPAKIDDD